MKNLPLIVILVLSLFGCGGSDDTIVDEVSVSSYKGRPGDVFSRERRYEFRLPDGEISSLIVKRVSTYEEVDVIPRNYNYNGDISGPYILWTLSEDGELLEKEYMTYDGVTIVYDFLEFFTRIDAETVGGTPYLIDASVGDYLYYQINSTIFDSQTTEKAGNMNMRVDAKVIDEEIINIPAGTFNCLKCEVEGHIRRTYNDSTMKQEYKGFQWVGVENGFIIKSTATGTVTYDNNATALTIEEVLIDYEIDINSSPTTDEHDPLDIAYFTE